MKDFFYLRKFSKFIIIMGITEKDKKEVRRIMKKIRIIERKNLPDYGNDPFFVKKKEDAYKALKEAPLPDFLAKRANG